MSSAAPAPVRKVAIWPVFVGVPAAIAATLLVVGITGAVFAVLYSAQAPDLISAPALQMKLSSSLAYLFAAATEGSLLLLAFAYLGWSPRTRALYRLGSGRASWLDSLLLIVMTGMAGVGISGLTTFLTGGTPAVWTQMMDRIRAGSGAWMIAMGVQVALLAPICEEAFFRGFVQGRLRSRWSPTLSLVVTSLLFGLMHLDPRHMLTAAVTGLALGWTVEVTGSIRTALAAHVLYNSYAVLTALPARSSSSSGSSSGAIFGAALLALAVLIGWLVKRRTGPLPELGNPTSVDSAAPVDVLPVAE